MTILRTRRKNLRFLSILLAIIFLALPAHAETYKWIDDKGALHITTSPPAENNAKLLSQSEDAAGEHDPDNSRKEEIKQHLYFWREQYEYHTGKCLQKEAEALCNRSAEMSKKNIELLQSDPDSYFAHIKKNGLVSPHDSD
jgi:hypothetical protein